MRSVHMQFPTGEGKLFTLDKSSFDELKYFKYGIYHVKIYNVDKRLLTYNTEHWYTHICLNRAIELKYKLELCEHENNALSYEGQLTNGFKLFGGYIDYLFKFKKEGHSEVKEYLNRLWGGLCKINIMTTDSIKHSVIQNNVDLITIGLADIDSDVLIMDTVIKDKFYLNSFARIKPFITAKARYMISKLIEKNIDNLVYCHTDSMVLKNKIHKSVKLGNDLGDLKSEGFCSNCIIDKCNGAIGKFIL